MLKLPIRTALALAVTGFIGGIAHADETADRTALRAIRQSYEEVVNNPKSGYTVLEKHFVPETTAVLVTDHEIASFREFTEYFAKIRTMIGEGGSYTVKTKVDKTELYGDLAVSRGTTEDLVVTDEKKEFKFRSHWTAVCRRIDGDWKIIRLHASMDPLENDFIRAKVAGTGKFYGITGFIAGALIATIGFGLYRFRSCRNKSRETAP